jgi:hypothetical protein
MSTSSNTNHKQDVPLMVRLDSDTAEQVRLMAEAGDRSVSQQLRRLVKMALAKPQPKEK